MADAPKISVYRLELAKAIGNLAVAVGEKGTATDQAEATHASPRRSTSRASWRTISRKSPTIRTSSRAPWRIRAFLGVIGNLADGLTKLIEAEAVEAAIASLFPERHDYRSQLAAIRNKRALLHNSLNDPKRAEESLRAALADLDFLVEVSEAVPLSLPRRALNLLAQILFTSQTAEAPGLMERSAAALRAAVKGPENREYRAFLYNTLSIQADILTWLGRFDESVKACEGWAR